MKFKSSIFSLFIFALCLQSNSLLAQQKIERKIIIQNGLFYFVSINDDTQMASLFTGSINEKLSEAKSNKIPIGREATEPFNPLAFDIKGNEMIGINWVLNSNNSRYEAIKAISLKNWEKPHPEWENEDWAQVSFDQPVIAPNEPWEKMLAANNILSNTFFDLTLTDELTMGICNQNKFWLYSYDGTSWKKKNDAEVKFKHYFSIINKGAQVAIVDAVGNMFLINNLPKASMTLAAKAKDEQVKILIIDKDKQKNYLVAAQVFAASSMKNLTQIINESAQELIF